MLTRFKNHSARAVPYRTALAKGYKNENIYGYQCTENLLPLQPVPTIPPIVYISLEVVYSCLIGGLTAPGPGSS